VRLVHAILVIGLSGAVGCTLRFDELELTGEPSGGAGASSSGGSASGGTSAGASGSGGGATGGSSTGGSSTGGSSTGGSSTGGASTGGASTGGASTGGASTGGGGGGGADPCGNGVIDPQESCDDGNNIDDDGCTNQCVVDCPVIDGVDTFQYIDPDTAHCYLLATSESGWVQADTSCFAWGGRLATIGSAIEHTRVTSQATGKGSINGIWIGYNDIDIEDTFVWVSGQTPGYVNWHVVEPNGGAAENCGRLGKTSSDSQRRWVDAPCNEQNARLCERSPGLPD